MTEWPLHLKYLIGAALIAIAAVAAYFGNQVLNSAIDDQKNAPNITLRKVAYFWVGVDHEMYQVGAIVRLFNLGAKPYLIKGIILNATKPLIYGRGQAHLRQIFVTQDRTEITDDNFMRASSEATFKMLLPIKFEATIDHPPPPGISFVGQWVLNLGREEKTVEGEFFGTFDRVISQSEWAAIGKAGSAIDIDSISFLRPAPPVPTDAPYRDFILYNPDRTATFEVFGFANVPPARASRGTIIYVRGRINPPLDGGWVMLGHSYEEVWADPEKRALYNAIFPPAPDGSPRAIGVFQ